jgi:hypothetical protein
MAKLTKAELAGLRDPETLAANALRSRSTLKVISLLYDKGMIEYDMGEGTVTLTDSGRAALAQGKSDKQGEQS